MPDEPSSYAPATIEKVFELLDTKLVSLGVPTALCAVGFSKLSDDLWAEATWCFVGAAGVWLAIKIGKKLAPKFDKLLDWVIENLEQLVLKGWATLSSDFESQYLKQQARLCEEFTTEGYNPDRITIPLLEEVFVPLELSGSVVLDEYSDRLKTKSARMPRHHRNAGLASEHLDVWQLLARSRRDRKFRQISILAKGGMGKTTLLRHVALIYGQRKHRQYGAPKLVPVLLRLRDWSGVLTQEYPPSLARLIDELYVPNLSKSQPLVPPHQWAEYILASGNALVMFDGFDEVPDGKRPQVSQWLSAQMRDYRQSVFILTSRPAGFRDYVAQKPTIPIFINTFSLSQQERFIQRWYLCQERCCRSEKQVRRATEVAKERADDLISQLRQRQKELGEMANNPLLLNMLTTFHRFDTSVKLPQRRIDLYRGICKLQLDDRPKARMIQMTLSFENSDRLLQCVAFAMVKGSQIKVEHQTILSFLSKQTIFQQEEVNPADWLRQIVEVSELLVEREQGEYEFPHLSFQGFFTATYLAQSAENARLVLQNWTGAVWRETVLLYTAQLNPKLLNQVIHDACNIGGEAAELAAICLKEYPRPEKVSDELTTLLRNLTNVAQGSKYQTLESLLKAQHWQEADEETYRLMIVTVGKEVEQDFYRADFENFPCEDLQIIDRLWLTYSKTLDHPNGKWGFSVQKRIWQECDTPVSFTDDWVRFADRVGWRNGGQWLGPNEHTFDLETSLPGEFPCAWSSWCFGYLEGDVFGLSSLAQRLVECSMSQF